MLFTPLSRANTIAAPCKLTVPLVAEIVRSADEARSVTEPSEVISVFAPLAAAPRLARAPTAVVAPVPPLFTLSGAVKLILAKVGVAPVPISCTVFTAPLATVKLAASNDASPLRTFVASRSVMVVPLLEILFGSAALRVIAPVRLFRLFTPVAPGQVTKLSDPSPAETRH